MSAGLDFGVGVLRGVLIGYLVVFVDVLLWVLVYSCDVGLCVCVYSCMYACVFACIRACMLVCLRGSVWFMFGDLGDLVGVWLSVTHYYGSFVIVLLRFQWMHVFCSPLFAACRPGGQAFA